MEDFTLHRTDTQFNHVTLPTKCLFFIFITNVVVSSVYANNHTVLVA